MILVLVVLVKNTKNVMGSKKLQKLYERVDDCKFCKADRNLLQHIHGFGVLNPELMLILVNPTYRNLSSDPKYKGARFPFIGVRQFWKVLANGGLIDKNVTENLPIRAEWKNEHTQQIQRELIRKKLFLTNIVKCCYGHSLYPENKVIAEQLKLLADEIKIIRPRKIVVFGGLVYKTLTGKNIKLAEYWNKQKIGNDSEIISGLKISVIPCYFPIGRGNPKKAAEIMRKFLSDAEIKSRNVTERKSLSLVYMIS